MGIITDILISADGRKQTFLTSGIHQKRKMTASKRPDKFQECVSQKMWNIKIIHEFSWINALLGCSEQRYLEV